MLNLKQEHLKVLIDIFESYCPDSEVFAYGSRVNGDFHSGSDLDLVVKNFDKSISELKNLIINTDIPFLVDINEFDKLPLSFQKEIEKSNMKIFPN